MIVLASRPHYAAHLAPIVRACPDLPDDIALVASYLDLVKARRLRIPRIVLAQHGVGQSYSDRNPAYPGGRDNHDVSLFLVPNEHSAGRWRQAYPHTPVAVVGSPRLDDLPGRDGGPAAVVAVSFHPDYRGVPERRSAFAHFRHAVVDLARRFHVIGHAHPLRHDLARFYARNGIEFVPDFDDVCRRADLYVCDNSSTLYEFASTGRPVVLLNAPDYRKDVDHGLRFWDAAHVGRQVDDPMDLAAAVEWSLDAMPDDREDALSIVYGVHREGAAVRAAAALSEWAKVPVAA